MNTFNLSRFRFVALAAMVALLGMIAMTANAQTTTGTIYGTVTDSSGAIIPSASVVVTDVATGISHTVLSNSSGEYIFPALNPGDYSLSTKVTGFKSETQRGITLRANQNVHVNFALSVGSLNETVTVSADTTLVDTREAQLGETVEQQRIQQLPLNGRNVYDLVVLVPGITNYSSDSATGSRTGVSFSVSGLPTNTVSYYLDGTSDTAFYQNGGDLMPNPDALQEFRLVTSNFDAEFGRSPGGVVNAITRSGTKDFHGAAYEYLRNDAFNAKNYFLTTTTPLKQDQFGGNFGGPLLPNRRAFIFLSYEHYLIHTPVAVGPTAITTATQYERTGDFSHDPTAITSKIKLPAGTNCGTTAAPVICAAALDPVAQNLLKFVPVENDAGTATTQQNANGDTDANQGLGRIDYQLTPAHSIEALFFTSHGTTLTPNVGANRILSYSGMSNYENQVNTALVDTWTLSPRTLNNLRVFYSQNRYIIGDLYPDHLLPQLGSNAPEGGVVSAPPYFAITGYWTMGTNQNGPSDISQQSFGLIDTANLTRGHHEIKLGGSYIWNKYAQTGGLQTNGIFTFTGNTSGNALADFLMGRANSLVQTTAVINRNHNIDPSVFAQDDWQLMKRLNLNLGLRWEAFGPMVGDPNNGTFNPGVQSKIFPTAPLGLLYQGDPGVPQGVFHEAYRFAPRLGFAYDVFGNGRTGLRGGYGIFYYLPNATDTGNLQQQPYNLSVTTAKTPSLVNPYAPGVDPFPFTFNPANAVWTTGATIKAAPVDGGFTSYTQEYNLTLEQQFSKQWALRIGYVGNAVRKMMITHDINAPTYSPTCTTATCTATAALINARRPFEPTPGIFGAINENDDANNFSYNSLQTTLRGRVGSHLDLQAFYVWSKGMSYEGPVVSGRNLQLDRGRSSTNLPNNFTASVLYHLPEAKNSGFFGKEVLSGWQLNGLTQLQSGSEFTVISGTDTNFDNTVNDRADIVGNPYTQASTRAQKILKYLNPAAFATPTGPFGNEQNNSMNGPKFFSTNLSAFKIFPLYPDRGVRLEFRAEAFNAFNNVNLGTPVANEITLNTDLSKGANQITSESGSARVMQFALKLLF